METQKIYLAGNSGNGGGSDLNAIWAALMNNNGGFGGGNGAWWLLFLLAFARGGFGFGDNGNLQSQLCNDKANSWVLQALQGNEAAIGNLATSLNCDVKAIQSTLCNLSTLIQGVAAKTELSSSQIINAIQAGNAQLITLMGQCCCDIKGILSEGFSSVGYLFRDLTCNIEKSIGNATAKIIEGQKDAEMREVQRELAQLREEKQKYQFGSMLGAYISPLQQEISEIKCKLPKTVVVPAGDEYIRVDRSLPATLCGGYGAAFNNPYGPFFNGGGFFG